MKRKLLLITLSLSLLVMGCEKKEDKVSEVPVEEEKAIKEEKEVSIDDLYYAEVYLPLESNYAIFTANLKDLNTATTNAMDAIKTNGSFDKENLKVALDNFTDSKDTLASFLNHLAPIDGMNDDQVESLNSLSNNLKDAIRYEYKARSLLIETMLDDGDYNKILEEVTTNFELSNELINKYVSEKNILHGEFNANSKNLKQDLTKASEPVVSDVEKPTDEEFIIGHEFMEELEKKFKPVIDKYFEMNDPANTWEKEDAELNVIEQALIKEYTEKYNITEDELTDIIVKIAHYESSNLNRK